MIIVFLCMESLRAPEYPLEQYTKLATRVGFFYTPIWFPVHQSLYVLLRGWLPTTDLLRLTLTFPPLFFATDHIQKSPPLIWSFSLITPTQKFNFFGKISVHRECLIQHTQLLMSKSEKISKITRTEVSVYRKVLDWTGSSSRTQDIETFKDQNFCLCFDNDDISAGYTFVHKNAPYNR